MSSDLVSVRDGDDEMKPDRAFVSKRVAGHLCKLKLIPVESGISRSALMVCYSRKQVQKNKVLMTSRGNVGRTMSALIISYSLEQG